MRLPGLISLLVVPAAAAAAPAPSTAHVAMAPAADDICKGCTRVAQVAFGKLTAEVWDQADKPNKTLSEVWVVVRTGDGVHAAKVADYAGGGSAGHYDWAVRETPHVRRSAYDVMQQGKLVTHDDVGVMLDVDTRRSSDNGVRTTTASTVQKVFVTCGLAEDDSWSCGISTFGGFHDPCSATGWDAKVPQPIVHYSCAGELYVLPSE